MISLFPLNPSALLSPLSEFKNKYVHIAECRCPGTHLLDRRVYPHFRKAVEDCFISKLMQNHPKTNSKIRLMSLGSGGCFQELMILIQLVQNGYTNIQITLIDTCYLEENTNYLGSIESVKELINCIETEIIPTYKDAHISVSYDTNLERYLSNLSEKMFPQACLLIDLQSTPYSGDEKTLLHYGIHQLLQCAKIPGNTLLGFTQFNASSSHILVPGVFLSVCVTKEDYKTKKIAKKLLSIEGPTDRRECKKITIDPLTGELKVNLVQLNKNS